jgi:hypothetical protein
MQCSAEIDSSDEDAGICDECLEKWGITNETTLIADLVEQRRALDFGWCSYLNMVVPSGAGPNQIEECRRAFFGGVVHLWTLLHHARHDAVSCDECLSAIEDEVAQTVIDIGGR